MIVGCYDMHLYCDFPDDSWEHRSDEPAQFTERTFTSSKREAIRRGWRFHSDRERVICPACIAAGRKLPKT